jgi:hypothetical protein
MLREPKPASFPPGNFFLWMSLVRDGKFRLSWPRGVHGSEAIVLAGLCVRPALSSSF